MQCIECEDMVDTDFRPFNFDLELCSECENVKNAVEYLEGITNEPTL